MDFETALSTLRGWQGRPVVVVLEPDGSVMEGPLRELEASGIDGALFTVTPSGAAIAVALFRDAFAGASLGDDGVLRIRQGRVDILVAPERVTDGAARER